MGTSTTSVVSLGRISTVRGRKRDAGVTARKKNSKIGERKSGVGTTVWDFWGCLSLDLLSTSVSTLLKPWRRGGQEV